jgi:hypothetical protein
MTAQRYRAAAAALAALLLGLPVWLAIRAFFNAVDGAEPGPVFVHCRRGTDRTGAIVAFYRIARQGWEAEKAAKEARDVGMRSWDRGLQQQIKAFTAPSAPACPGGQ